MNAPRDQIVRQFRHILLWPLQLVAPPGRERAQPWSELFEAEDVSGLWQAEESAFEAPEGAIEAGRYHEFMAFLPSVRRFLYGQGRGPNAHPNYGESPIRVYARSDIDRAVIELTDGWSTELQVVNCRLMFFYDVDITILVMELAAENLPLERAIDIQYRLGRAFPSGWHRDGRAVHCARSVRWLAADDSEIARSDFDAAEKYLQAVRVHRAATVAEHWIALLRPMTLHFSMEHGPVRFRQVEHQRMPSLSYLSVDDPFSIDEADFIRLALGLAPDSPLAASPDAARALRDEHAYDRYWSPSSQDLALSTRVLCNGHATTFVGSANNPAFADSESGLLTEYRHQIKLLTLIAHFHRAAILLQSDQQVYAVSQLDLDDPVSVSAFKRRVRRSLESFLRFNHRYWFHEISNQPLQAALFGMMRRQLNVDALFDEVREEVLDMSQYLDSDDARRQSESVLRLTVVTILGMVATIATGFLGMNLFAMADWGGAAKFGVWMLVLLPTVLLTIVTVRYSRSLSRWLDRLGRDQQPGLLRQRGTWNSRGRGDDNDQGRMR
ncbi:MAG: CorA family divalent cation transporter [Burkholderiaceae bacterium]